ncbi:hypothetical protein AVEN_196564-1 [Araneus ventricosus]|uniref:Uncharacterized protein n=1 Tax=Araneus ventricosus TaxID=182803 RepID=A0A4Y2BB83_ARAVE|nr:hypothetical protein AVEN_196564-1 [Araneus ventricosus]
MGLGSFTKISGSCCFFFCFLCGLYFKSISIGTKDDLLDRGCVLRVIGVRARVSTGEFWEYFFCSGGVHGNCAKLTVRRRLRKCLMRLSCLMKDPFVFVSELFVKLDFGLSPFSPSSASDSLEDVIDPREKAEGDRRGG